MWSVLGDAVQSLATEWLESVAWILWPFTVSTKLGFFFVGRLRQHSSSCLARVWQAVRVELKYNPYLLMVIGSLVAFICTLISIVVVILSLAEDFQKTLDALLWHGTVRSISTEMVKYWIPWPRAWQRTHDYPLAIADAPSQTSADHCWYSIATLGSTAVCLIIAQARRR